LSVNPADRHFARSICDVFAQGLDQDPPAGERRRPCGQHRMDWLLSRVVF